jgi:hypothetical protein
MCKCDAHPHDVLNEISNKVSFIASLAVHAAYDPNFTLNSKDLLGLHCMLREAETAIDAVLAH